MLRPAKKTVFTKRVALLLAGLFLVALTLTSGTASGAHLSSRKVTIGNDSVSAVTSYTIGFQIATPGTLGSIDIMFCSNTPLIGDSCTVPAGLDASAAVLSNQTGEVGFSISNASTANNLILTRVPSAALAQNSNYYFDNVTNPSAGGSYYVRVQTYATNDATGPSTDDGGMAYGITDSLKITSEVPPYVLFCAAVSVPAYNCSSASGSIVDLGNIKSSTTSGGQSQMLVATNAGNGYSIYMQGTTLTSGNDIINSLSLPAPPATGSNQFGLNLRANLNPAIGQDPAGLGSGVPTTDYNQPNKYKFAPNDVIASSALAEDYRRFTVSYIANATKSQAPGTYVSTVTFVAVGNF